jgi:hypothetical protein
MVYRSPSPLCAPAPVGRDTVHARAALGVEPKTDVFGDACSTPAAMKDERRTWAMIHARQATADIPQNDALD